jgi:trypsin
MAMRVGVVRVVVAALAAVLLVLPVAAGAHVQPAPHRAKPHAHTAIVGGVPAPAGSWPWVAYIIDQVSPSEVETCTGTVIAPNVILTAAHCAEDVSTSTLDDPSNFAVVTGSLDWTDAATRQVSAVSELIVHTYVALTVQDYGINIIGDAALLVLSTPTTAPPIALADSSDLALIQPGVAADFAGWGLTDGSDQSSSPDALQEASTVVQSDLYCTSIDAYFASTAQLCTLDVPADDTGTCSGDSGGPLVAQTTNGTWVEIGLTSTGTCNPALPDTFTRVDYISAWAQSWITAVAPPPAPLPTPPPVVVVTPPPAATTTTPTATTPAAPAADALGRYTGTSSQPPGHVNVTVGAKGVTRLGLQFNLRCSRGKHLRGPYVETAVDTTTPVRLVAVNGVWTFTTRYEDTAGNHYSLTGTFPTTSSATGTLSVMMYNHVCSTGLVHWAASLP